MVDPAVEAEQVARLEAWRQGRDEAAVEAALAALSDAAREGRNIMPPSIAAAKAGVTTGEWGYTLRAVFGEYRAPTGVGRAMSNAAVGLDELRAGVDALSARLGRRLKFLLAKPGLDGHSNGAEQIAVRARDCGMEVLYEGIRLTPARIVEAAVAERPHILGLSVLSGSHMELIGEVMEGLRAAGLDIPVVAGGIIPEGDARRLREIGVARVYTPKDFAVNRIMEDVVALVIEGTREVA